MKKILCLMLSIFVFPFVACHSCGTSANAHSLPQTDAAGTESVLESTTDAMKGSDTEPVQNSSDDKTAEPVWNTADADVSQIHLERKLISFTFDDAPDSTLKELLNTFAAFNKENPDCPASATVFANGIRVTSSSLALLQAAYFSGFELGNHTWSHKNLNSLPPEKIRSEIDTVDKVLQKIDGKETHLLRTPFGEMNAKVKKETKTPLIYWTIDTEDWKKISAEKIYQAVYSEKSPGAIVLMHDGYPHTVEAVKRLLPDLKAAGYQVVNVSQLSKALDCPLMAGKVYTRVKQ